MYALQVAIAASPGIIHHWGWFLAFGIALLFLGIVAIGRSVAATVASMIFFGWLLWIAAIVEIISAITVGGGWSYFFPHLLAAILFAVVGLFLIRKPVISGEVLTMFMAIFFLVGGLFEVISLLATMPPDWGWQVFSGVVSIVLGVLILANWPSTGLWVIGLFVGIRLFFDGVAWIALALDLHRAGSQIL
jgi:uncharacterized membrane protein HdeD (DUF308 family)